MNKEKQRLSIAKAHGFTQLKLEQMPNHSDWKGFINEKWKWIPKYPEDLNAMHQARKVLTKDQELDYAIQLGKLVSSHLPLNRATRIDFNIANATAAQHAEAFLKTLRLWEKES